MKTPNFLFALTFITMTHFSVFGQIKLNSQSSQSAKQSSKTQSDVKKTFGVGIMYAFPVFGASVKYALTDNHVLQAAAAPFGGSGNFSIASYGARYNYRFTTENPQLLPYLFVAAGLMTYSYEYTTISYSYSSYGRTTTSTVSDNTFSYSAGAGVEYIAAKALGLSVEGGYGKISIGVPTGSGTSSDIGLTTFMFGLGIHYYFK